MRDHEDKVRASILIGCGTCPDCNRQDLHDGPRAIGTVSQCINIACFSCDSRFNVCLVGDNVMFQDRCGNIAGEDRAIFNPEPYKTVAELKTRVSPTDPRWYGRDDVGRA